MPKPPQEGPSIEEDIQRLEMGIRQLRIQYEMFFAGGLKREPIQLRGAVVRIIKRYLETPIRKYQHRFHFNALVARYNIMSEHWGRRLRTREEGERLPAGALSAPTEELVSLCKISDPNVDKSALQQLHKSFQAARKKSGEGQLSFDKFLRGVGAQAQKIKEKAGCEQVELRVVVKDDKVELRARAARK